MESKVMWEVCYSYNRETQNRALSLGYEPFGVTTTEANEQLIYYKRKKPVTVTVTPKEEGK